MSGSHEIAAVRAGGNDSSVDCRPSLELGNTARADKLGGIIPTPSAGPLWPRKYSQSDILGFRLEDIEITALCAGGMTPTPYCCPSLGFGNAARADILGRGM